MKTNEEIMTEFVDMMESNATNKWGALSTDIAKGKWHKILMDTEIYQAMKERVEKVEGVLEVGSVVQVPLHDVDTTKVDGKTLTLVVVEKRQLKNDNAPKYKLACAKGPLKNWYSRSRINAVPLGSAASLGLTNVLAAWEGMAPITERAAAASVSLVGGQGKKFCGCRGKCNTKQCCCKKAARLCNSHCHGGVHNKNCKNCG